VRHEAEVRIGTPVAVVATVNAPQADGGKGRSFTAIGKHTGARLPCEFTHSLQQIVGTMPPFCLSVAVAKRESPMSVTHFCSNIQIACFVTSELLCRAA
jgi:hypothetical protein